MNISCTKCSTVKMAKKERTAGLWGRFFWILSYLFLLDEHFHKQKYHGYTFIMVGITGMF